MSVAEMGSPMLTPGGVFSDTSRFVRGVRRKQDLVPRRPRCPKGAALRRALARASATHTAKVMTGMYCLIDSPVGLLNEEIPALPPTRATSLPPEMPYSIRLQLYHYYVSIEIRVSYLDKYNICSITGLWARSPLAPLWESAVSLTRE